MDLLVCTSLPSTTRWRQSTLTKEMGNRMPCYDGGYPPTSDNAEIKKIHKLTRLLCGACEIMDEKIHTSMPKELRQWWQKHQEADKKREEAKAKEAQKQALKKQLLESFTEAEKEALGIR